MHPESFLTMALYKLLACLTMAESYPDDAVGSDWLFPLQHDAAVTDWSSSHVHRSTARGYRHTDTDTEIYVLAHTHTHTHNTHTHTHTHTHPQL